MTIRTLSLAGTMLLGFATAGHAEMLTFKADMTPGNEAPPAANSHGSGQATVTIDSETKKVTWQIAVKDLTGDPPPPISMALPERA